MNTELKPGDYIKNLKAPIVKEKVVSDINFVPAEALRQFLSDVGDYQVIMFSCFWAPIPWQDLISEADRYTIL